MAMYVNTNVASLSGQRNLQNVTDRMNSSFEKLSSGSRINSARDDAAGLQIANRLTTQLTGLNQANRNANDGISIAQIAEGALGEITSNVQRMRQLVVQGGNRTLSENDRAALGDEFKQLMQTNDDITERTAYGNISLLNYDSSEAGFQIQSGAQSGQQDTVTTGNSKLTSLFGDILAAEGAAGALSTISTVVQSEANGVASANAGLMGKLIVAQMITTNQSSFSIARAELIGADSTTTSLATGNLSDMANNSRIQLDMDTLTNLLTFDGTVLNTLGSATSVGSTNLEGHLGVSTIHSNALDYYLGAGFDGLSSAEWASQTGFTDDQINAVNGFVTDTMMEFMSGLVTEVDKQRSKLGAEQNGLMSTVRANTAAVVNVSDSRARITDTDFATETAELTRNQIIQQAATSILSQANQLPNAALSLLR